MYITLLKKYKKNNLNQKLKRKMKTYRINVINANIGINNIIT